MPTTRSGRAYSSNSNQKEIDPLPSSSSSSIDKVHYVSPSPPKEQSQSTSFSAQSSSIPLNEQSAAVNNDTVVALSVGDSRIGRSGTFKVKQKKRYDFSIFAHSGDGNNMNDTNCASTSNHKHHRNNTVKDGGAWTQRRRNK